MSSCNGARRDRIKLFGVWLEKPEPINVSEDEASQLSDESTNQSRNTPKKWTEEEHRLFLIGLEKLGKGNWKEMSHQYVVTRTSVQVASHAQKYYNRQAGSNGRKRRGSVFDMQIDHIETAPIDFNYPFNLPFSFLQEPRDGQRIYSKNEVTFYESTFN